MTRQPEPEFNPLNAQGGDLYQAILALTSEHSLETVLQKVADLSRKLVGASYSALGVLGPNGRMVRFMTSGVSLAERERIGRPPQGGGVLGVVIQEAKPLRLRDIAAHPQSAGFPQHHPVMTSFLGVPIVYQERVLGDLYLANKIGAEEFSQDDENLVTLFAGQAAVVIENTRLFENEARRSAQLDALNSIGRELTRILDLDQLLQRVAELLQESFDYQNVQVFWFGKADQQLQLRALVGPLGGKIPLCTATAVDQGIAGWVATHQQSVLANDVSLDSRYVAVKGFETRSQLAVPVILKGEVVAVVNVDGMDIDAFDDSDLRTLETLADQLAVAIENIQLYQEQQQQSLQWAVVEERDRIGRDLHDGVIQSIYAVGLTLEDIAARSGQTPEEVQQRIEGAVGDLNQVIGDIRSYIMELRPRELQGRRFDDALASLIQYLEDRTPVTVSLDLGIDLNTLHERLVVNLWHVLQEAFSNIEKYAGAETVALSLGIHEGILLLEIVDDGVGFDLEKAEFGRGYGLSNIKDRAENLGGFMVIDSAPGKGTQLRISIPMDS